MTRSRNRMNSPPINQQPMIQSGFVSPMMRPPGIPIKPHSIPYGINQFKIHPMYRMIYRDYYVQQFKSIYSTLMVNHQQHIRLNQHIYVTNEFIRSGRKEYQFMLNQQESCYKLQLNTMNYLIQNVWKLIDEMDKSCFPDIHFGYDHEFRNIYMLFELIRQIISNKIE
jgi:hypothetical protein